jgi:hypothetical protein
VVRNTREQRPGGHPDDNGTEDPKGKAGKGARKVPNTNPRPGDKEAGEKADETGSGQGKGPGTKEGGTQGAGATPGQPGIVLAGKEGTNPSGTTGSTSNKVAGGGQYVKPTAEQLEKLFRPGSKGRPSDKKAAGKDRKAVDAEAGEPGPKNPRQGKPQESTDPAVRAAALRLQMAIQRIQANRDLHRSQSPPGEGGMPAPIRKRDW